MRKPRLERKQLAGVAQQVTSQDSDPSPNRSKPHAPGQPGNTHKSCWTLLPQKHLEDTSWPGEGLWATMLPLLLCDKRQEVRCPLLVELNHLPLWSDPLDPQSRGAGTSRWKRHHTPKARAPSALFSDITLECLQVLCRCVLGVGKMQWLKSLLGLTA